MDWNGRMEYGMEYGMNYGIHIFHSNTQLYCVAICLLTYSLEVLGVEGHVHI